MPAPAKMPHPIQLNLPEATYEWLHSETERRGMTVEEIISLALKYYAESEDASFDITQTRTWQLCGALTVSEPDPAYISGYDEQGDVITDYAEHVDDVLYREP